MARTGQLIALPALTFAVWSLLTGQLNAETYELECKKVVTNWGDTWLCQREWLPHGSRITAEQRITVNAVVAMTLIAPVGRRRL